MTNPDTQFKPGNPGGPGRPKGSKNKLSENFLQALSDDFEKEGPASIGRLRSNSPGEYLRIIAGLVPKELLLEVTQEEKTAWVINASPRELTNEQWMEMHGLDSLADEGSITKEPVETE